MGERRRRTALRQVDPPCSQTLLAPQAIPFDGGNNTSDQRVENYSRWSGMDMFFKNDTYQHLQICKKTGAGIFCAGGGNHAHAGITLPQAIL